MPTVTIKNIPRNLYKKLKESAAMHRRSINSEVITCLERALRSNRLDAEAFLESARALRNQMGGIFIRDADLRMAKNEGRL